ncbi:hypothetical protein QBC44DRAFT_369807 [Cladorrhinum sp. PSN332]|nr:hypothetical protein QBC44DRAFT_369807 [Cladorrhinum sp. PSN332]
MCTLSTFYVPLTPAGGTVVPTLVPTVISLSEPSPSETSSIYKGFIKIAWPALTFFAPMLVTVICATYHPEIRQASDKYIVPILNFLSSVVKLPGRLVRRFFKLISIALSCIGMGPCIKAICRFGDWIDTYQLDPSASGPPQPVGDPIPMSSILHTPSQPTAQVSDSSSQASDSFVAFKSNWQDNLLAALQRQSSASASGGQQPGGQQSQEPQASTSVQASAGQPALKMSSKGRNAVVEPSSKGPTTLVKPKSGATARAKLSTLPGETATGPSAFAKDPAPTIE